ncbi:glutamate-1-semialdehyde 2,1-aminomutase [Verrucomicrobiaceae bacterium 5K15]|uniref:Glutamate-1-semialdehyde 2,1-aminomutase n=1 Tax=Oceaniferula flava TaxID=2800421 RepID=A0AAE2SBN5_9BACT|nr:glutamate-1-semialdehyde 2,1-aminomutase [Oceaniferula flavus]MBK1854057.1 glutamate-1-semialdehyde 2,1-aminomutase [Oceaniferula flavus]MBM1135363.1 glutamate-1-semialdehyde 2,1-aminomutase [Oceaniferula flavus]
MKRDISSKLFKAAKQVIPGGVNSPVRAFKNVDGDPFFVRRAMGCRIEDVDGNEMIDYVGTWGPAILGHAPECVVEAVQSAAKEGVSFGTPNPYEVDMAETIVDWVPSVEKVRMVNSGTEATMSAIRLARGFTGRDKVIKFVGCYHGHVDSLLVAAGSGALTHGKPDSAGVPASFAAETIILPYNDIEKVNAVFAEMGDQIAAVIVESYPANAGLIFPKEGYLQGLRDITAKHGAVFIFDEVMTGFRVAKGGVQELEGITPDLTAMGKVIGGGLPVGAFGGKAEIMDYLAPDGPVYQAGTLSGNPLAMAAGLAQLREMERQDGYAKLDQLGARLEAGVRALLQEKSLDYQFNRVGSMFCLFFTGEEIVDLDSVMTADTAAFRKFFTEMLEQGVYTAPSPYETGFISVSHGEAEIDRTLEAMSAALAKI